MKRFEREARAASALNHPNICTIHAVEEHEGQPFIVMELLEGSTLRDMIADCAKSNSTLPIPTLLDYAIQIAQGLEAAHQKGIIHRDIKPANIFITNHGQAKILDFGLAKLHESETAEARSHESTQTLSHQEGKPLLTLTRTGTTVGTAAYMSPEQVRCEKVDSRTDLFSFGLVLYEMATRHRAFEGDSTPVLHQAILNETPLPVRDLNPAIPSKVESVIDKASRKQREDRYQSAFDLRTDLQKLKGAMELRGSRRWRLGAAIMLFLVFASLWFAVRHQRSVSPPLDLKLKQLTSNSYENRVTDGRISPDGKYLVYTDRAGMHLKNIETNETHSIPLPDALRHPKMELSLADASWSRDSTKFLANAHPAGIDVEAVSQEDVIKRGGLSIWEFSVRSGTSRMLREMAWADSYSPDGSLISFNANKGRYGPREIWLMDSNGGHARKILDGGDEYGIDSFVWSPDGRRVRYIRHNESTFEPINLIWEGDHLGKEIPRNPTVPLFGTEEVLDGAELPDGRIISSVKDGRSGSNICNFWTTHVDPRTGSPIDKPVRLTHWPGFCMSQISFTADGKRLAFLEWASHSHTTVDVAQLHDGATRITNLHHFTLSDSADWPCDWTPDSNTLIFHSNRDGHGAIYKQSLNADSPEVLVENSGSQGCGKVSPDGKWLLYVHSPESDVRSAPHELIRVPMTAGTAQTLFSFPHGNGTPSCARFPSNTCVIFERTEDRKEVIVTAFDPLKGLGNELTRIGLDPNMDGWDAALSADGTRVALISGSPGQIKIISLRGEPTRELQVKDSPSLLNCPWAADGNALFVSASISGGYALLRVGLDGKSQPLIANHTPDVVLGLPSPDSRNLAVMAAIYNQNVWMMENF